MAAEQKNIILCCDCEGTWDELERMHLAIESAGIAANYFFVGETARQHPSLVKEIASLHQAECHTDTHPNLRRLGKEEQRGNILRGRRTLEDLIGREVRGFRAPYHHLNRDTVDILNEEGFLFDASMLYFRYDPGGLKEIYPTWFREWMPLYGTLGLKPGTTFGVFRTLVRWRQLCVLPAHPQYSGKDARLASAFRDFLGWAVDEGVRFWSIDEYLEANFGILPGAAAAGPSGSASNLAMAHD